MSKKEKSEKIKKITPEEIQALGNNGPISDSPINLSLDIMTQISLPLLEWTNENEPPRLMKITNTGETVVVSAKWQCPRPYISNGPLVGKYVFAQFHLHWGPLEIGGSEHTFNGVRLPLEMHVMFFKSEYICQEAAMKKSDGVLSIAYVTELHEEENSNFKPIIDNLHRIGTAGTSQSIELLPITQFFPTFSDDYYMYWGNIINLHSMLWLICRKPLPISIQQIKQFRCIRNKNREVVKLNFSAIKPLKDSQIFYVNPQSPYVKDLIIPLADINTPKFEKKKKGKPNLTEKISRKKSNKEVNVHYFYKRDKYDSDSSDKEAKRRPTIEKSDIEDESQLNIIFGNKLKESFQTYVGKKNSLTDLSKSIKLKQEEGESYNKYLERVENSLKAAMAKLESKKVEMMFDTEGNREIEPKKDLKILGNTKNKEVEKMLDLKKPKSGELLNSFTEEKELYKSKNQQARGEKHNLNKGLQEGADKRKNMLGNPNVFSPQRNNSEIRNCPKEHDLHGTANKKQSSESNFADSSKINKEKVMFNQVKKRQDNTPDLEMKNYFPDVRNKDINYRKNSRLRDVEVDLAQESIKDKPSNIVSHKETHPAFHQKLPLRRTQSDHTLKYLFQKDEKNKIMAQIKLPLSKISPNTAPSRIEKNTAEPESKPGAKKSKIEMMNILKRKPKLRPTLITNLFTNPQNNLSTTKKTNSASPNDTKTDFIKKPVWKY